MVLEAAGKISAFVSAAKDPVKSDSMLSVAAKGVEFAAGLATGLDSGQTDTATNVTTPSLNPK